MTQTLQLKPLRSKNTSILLNPSASAQVVALGRLHRRVPQLLGRSQFPRSSATSSAALRAKVIEPEGTDLRGQRGIA
jgi:hypothetical protein